MIRVCACLMLLALVGVAADQQAWFVNNVTGDDSHDGRSESTALQSLATAVKKLQPGDRLEIANTGVPYYETLRLHGTLGSAEQPLEINGHGAVLSGLRPLDPDTWEAHEQGYRYPYRKLPTNLRPQLWRGDTPIPEAADVATCEPGQAVWIGDAFYFRPATPEQLRDPSLMAAFGESGVAGTSLRYVTIRDLVCERFSNDGFNLHGSCYAVRFERIESRWNGDDGFSVHEDGSTSVHGGYFHHNQYGIQDVNASRSSYFGVVLRDNRVGAHFSGGHHQLVDCLITGSEMGLQVNAGVPTAYLGGRTPQPRSAYRGETLLKDSEITDCQTGVWLGAGASAQLIQNLVTRIRHRGITAKPDADLELIGNVLAACGELELKLETTSLYDDGNLYESGSIRHGDATGLAAIRALCPDSRSEIGTATLSGAPRQRAQVDPVGNIRRGPQR